jgi:ATP-binding cassette subfamily B (MDR/TAP) protein 1
MYIYTYTGELNAKRVREKYLQAVLKQEVRTAGGRYTYES